jgi:hypothetical protein
LRRIVHRGTPVFASTHGCFYDAPDRETKMIRLFNACALVVALFLAGCGIRENIRPGAALEMDSESAVLVMGLSPNYRFHFIRGPVENNVWERPVVDVPEINLSPDSGYLVVKLKPTAATESFGISLVFPEKGRPYGPCQDSTAPTFGLKGGAVNYVGDLRYTFDGSSLRYEYSLDETKARTFLNANYPGYVDSLQVNPIKLMKVKSTICNQRTITAPILIPGR